MDYSLFNYKRNIPPVPNVYVPRVVNRKLKLPKHTTYVVSQVDIFPCTLPFCVAKHELQGMGRFCYCHRMNKGALLIGTGKPEPPQ